MAEFENSVCGSLVFRRLSSLTGEVTRGTVSPVRWGATSVANRPSGNGQGEDTHIRLAKLSPPLNSPLRRVRLSQIVATYPYPLAEGTPGGDSLFSGLSVYPVARNATLNTTVAVVSDLLRRSNGRVFLLASDVSLEDVAFARMSPSSLPESSNILMSRSEASLIEQELKRILRPSGFLPRFEQVLRIISDAREQGESFAGVVINDSVRRLVQSQGQPCAWWQDLVRLSAHGSLPVFLVCHIDDLPENVRDAVGTVDGGSNTTGGSLRGGGEFVRIVRLQALRAIGEYRLSLDDL